MRCRNCGSENRNTNIRCDFCGADLISEYICKDSYDFNLECLLYKKDIVECSGKYNYFL